MDFPEKAFEIYPKAKLEYQKKRYAAAYAEFEKLFGNAPKYVFSAPGRSEICGNHTDHNMGKAVGASIDLDIIAMVNKTESGRIRIKSQGYALIDIPFDDTELKETEKGTSPSLVKGILKRFTELGYKLGGFDAYCTSDVIRGSGLSSSAAYEVLICGILNGLYNGGRIQKQEIAMASHFAENVYFGKACGTLDQLSCAYGGMIAIDFENPECPKASPVEFDLTQTGYTMVITDVHSDHADLTDDYVAIRREMESVAKQFGKNCLRDVDYAEFVKALPQLKKCVSERALLRAYHYFTENERVDALCEAMEKNDMAAFLKAVNASGNSSYRFLQNIYSAKNPLSQAMSLALCVTENMLKDNYACRVHGGGFGGTIQTYVKNERADEYIFEMNRIFGKGSSAPLQVRREGCVMTEI